MNAVVFVKFPAKYSWLCYYIIHLLCRIIRHCIVLCYVSTCIKATVHCLLVQGRMETASTSVYMFDSAVRGQHLCKMYGLHSLIKRVSASCMKAAINVTTFILLHYPASI